MRRKIKNVEGEKKKKEKEEDWVRRIKWKEESEEE